MPFKGAGRPPVYKVNGKRVPGVTTILGNFTNPGGLVFWAFKQGKEHPEWNDPYGGGAAEIGTVCHSMVEQWIHGDDPNVALAVLDNEPEKRAGALKAYENFLEWWDMTGLRISATEVPITCSAGGGYGGTLDAIALDRQDRVCVIDWKTSKSIYPDNLCQVAAYGQAWEEMHPGVKINGGYHIARFAKEYPDFGHYHFEELDDARNLFNLLSEAHQVQKLVKKRL